MDSDKRTIYVVLATFFGAMATWFINHNMGYGPIVANGLVGVIAAVFMPRELAGITYTASFVGMSSQAVIPSIGFAGVGGLLVGLIWEVTPEIYAGIGGKGGTTAALATLITNFISRFR